MATYATNKERTNYARLCRAIIDLGSNVMRDILLKQVLPKDLERKLRGCPDLRYVGLRASEWTVIKRSVIKGSYCDFDISLMYTVLRALSVQELRDILKAQIPPSQLHTDVQNCPALISDPGTELRQDELNDVKQVCSVGSYDRCKDRLLWKLYKHICQKMPPIIHPSNPWGDNPNPADIEIGDDIERIRVMRHTFFGHITSTEMSDVDFNLQWNVLEAIMTRMSCIMPGKYYREELDLIKSMCIVDASEIRNDDEIESQVNAANKNIDDTERKLRREKQMQASRMDNIDESVTDLSSRITQKEDIVNTAIKVHENRIHAWILDDKTFVHTRASQSVKESIASKDFVAVTGVLGSGKSAIIHHVALELQSEGYSITPIDTVDDILRFWSKDLKQVFILDDPYGTHSLNDEEVNKWGRRIKSLQECLKHKVKILVSTRKNLLKEKKIANILENLKCEIVDINGQYLSLTEEEKKQIFEIHMKNTGKPVGDYCPSCDFLSFPLLCRIFSSSHTLLQTNAFFQRPMTVLQEEILQLRNKDYLTYFCLVICVVYDGKLDEHVFDISNVDRETKLKIDDFLELCRLSRSTSKTKIHMTLESLIGTYLMKVGSTYKFRNDFLYYFVLSTLSPEFQVPFLKHCSTTFLKERVKFPEMVEENKDDVHDSLILGNKSLVEAWRDRIVRNLNLSEDVSHELLKYCLLNGIPLEVLSLGGESVDLYIDALKNGHIELHDIRVIVIGPFDVGKTALTKRLLKIPFDINKRHSTDSVDLHKQKCIFDVKSGLWILDKDRNLFTMQLVQLYPILKSQPQELLYYLKVVQGIRNIPVLKEQIENVLSDELRRAKLLRNPASVESLNNSTKESTKEEKLTMHASGSLIHNAEKSTNVDTAIDVSYQASSNKTLKEKRKHEIEPEMQRGNDRNKRRRFETDLKKTIDVLKDQRLDPEHYGEVTFWDFGGQHVYYSTHHIYFTHRAIYTVVLDMRKSLDDVVEGDKVYVDIRGEEKWKYGDFLVFWLTSIYTYGKKAPVILVGTHADEVRVDRRRNYSDMIRSFLYKTHPHLQRIVKKIVSTDNHPNHSDEDFEVIRQSIFDLSRKREEYRGSKIPASWFELENELKLSGNIVKLFDIREVNSQLEVQLPDEELNLFLRLQHALGKYVYFNEQNERTSENLCDFVVLNPQWLVDALKCIVTADEFCKDCEWYGDWRNLKETAKLDDQLLNCPWKNAGLEKNFLGNKQILLEFLKRLDIIAPVHSESYNSATTGEICHFIPCMLQASIPERTLTHLGCSYQKHSSTLCYKLQEYIPSAVFHRLTVACMAEWPIFEFEGIKQIFCGCVIFDLEKSHNTILLISFVKYVIHLQILKRNEEENRQQHCSVREIIDRKISSILNLYDVEVSMERAHFIKCPEADLCSIEGMHSVEELIGVKDQRITCTKHELKEIHDFDRASCLQWWFPDIKVPETQSKEFCKTSVTEEKRQELHYNLRAAISGHISHNVGNLPKFKEKLRHILSPVDVSSDKSLLEVFDAMESQGHLEPGRYKELKSALRGDHENIIKMIEKTEQEMENVPGRSTADFRKMIDDTQSARLSDMKSLCNKSVGYIVTPKATVSGFRVGSKYVMTCWHVLEKIVKVDLSILGSAVTSHNEGNLNQQDVYIVFEYKKQGMHLQNNRFHFVGRIPYCNFSLDVLILELKQDGRSLPPKIIKYDKPDPNKDIYFIGHPGDKPMREDPCIRILERNAVLEKQIKEAEDWCSAKWGNHGYSSLSDTTKVLFHCEFQHGASGSPGMIVADGVDFPVIVLMLQGGAPKYYHDLTEAQQKMENIPNNFLLEFGMGMDTIFQDMRKPEYDDLRKDIFGS